MDIQTIDNQFNQLQGQAQQTIGELKDLAAKLQAAAQGGNQEAREWLLDLKSIAIAIQAEQNQVAGLLQAIHNYAGSQNQPQQFPQQLPQQFPQQPGWGQQPGYPQQAPYPNYPQQPPYGGGYNQGGGFLGELMNSGFGRAIVQGAGFGIGDDLINKIF